MISKAQARERMREQRKAMSDRMRREYDRMVMERLLQREEIKKATYFFPYVSYGTELDTLAMISRLLSEHEKRVCVPRVHGKEMDFYEIHAMSDLKEGYQGILEPVTQDIVPALSGVMLLPGLAFDLERHRVGYGGGFYDRYLSNKAGTDLCTIAIAYDFQIVEEGIDVDSFDISPDILLTEKRTIEAKGICL